MFNEYNESSLDVSENTAECEECGAASEILDEGVKNRVDSSMC